MTRVLLTGVIVSSDAAARFDPWEPETGLYILLGQPSKRAQRTGVESGAAHAGQGYRG